VAPTAQKADPLIERLLHKQDRRIVTKSEFFVKQMTPFQIAQIAPVVRECVLKGAPDEYQSDLAMCNIMCALYTGLAQCWAFLRLRKDEPVEFLGCSVTCLGTDPWAKYKVLNGLSIYASEEVHIDTGAWGNFVAALNEFAKQNGCHLIEDYTANPRNSTVAKIFGFDRCRYLWSRKVV